jgi:hypothetical protein
VRHFHSGLFPYTFPKPKGYPFRGRGFRYRLVKHHLHSHGEMIHAFPDGRMIRDERKEIVIDAMTEDAARRGHDLLWGAFSVVQAGEFFMDLYGIENAMLEDKVLKKDPSPFGRATVQTNGITQAAELAAKASWRRATSYAIAKFHFCATLCSVHLVDLDPHHATEIFPKFKRPINQVQAAAAIVQAYGVIEELGLEVRASGNKPSCLSDGTWNPVVKEELEDRLVRAGIDITDPVNWAIRGNKTKLETDKPRQIHHTSQKSPWAYWAIRDRMVDIVDAIAHLSWLRSHVSSHRLKASKAGLLTLYDVTNGQYLARQLILESMGLWKRWIREDAEKGD